MSYNSLGYFNLDLNNLTPAQEFVMKAYNKEYYLTNIFEALDYAQKLRSQGRTFCYKYIPLEPGLYEKIYDQNELLELKFISTFVEDPYTYDFSKPIDVFGREVLVDEVDKSFIITVKGERFYDQLYASLQMAQQFRDNGRYYCYYMKTPPWFLPKEQFNEMLDGRLLILLWYNRKYVEDPIRNIRYKLSSNKSW